MRRSSRRKRAHLWAWAYLALFGPGEDDADEGSEKPVTEPTDSVDEQNR